MSYCSGPDCTHSSHKGDQKPVEIERVLTKEEQMKRDLTRNQRRVFDKLIRKGSTAEAALTSVYNWRVK